MPSGITIVATLGGLLFGYVWYIRYGGVIADIFVDPLSCHSIGNAFEGFIVSSA